MTDRELLELAAKAAGIDLKPMQINNVREQGDDRFVGYMTDPEQWSRGWFNPLVDDGDALRLAVKLNLGISIPVHKTVRADVICFLDSSVNSREENGDPYAATRRAIVRVAAEIGKQMGGSDD